MKLYLTIIFITLFICSVFSQSNNYVLLENTQTWKKEKIMLNRSYSLILKDNFLNTVDSVFLATYLNDKLLLKLTNANLTTLFFNDTIAIPFNEIISIGEQDNSYYVKSVLAILSYSGLGVMNYQLLKTNTNVTELVFLNIFTGLLPFSVALTFSSNDINLHNYKILSIGSKTIFNRAKSQKTIFNR